MVDRQQALSANLDVARLDKTKAQAELERLEGRSRLMAEERAGLRGWQRQRRADFEQQAVAHQRAAQHWGAATERAAASYDTATGQLASFRDQNGAELARSQDTQGDAVAVGSPELADRTRAALVDPPQWLKETLGPRPEQFRRSRRVDKRRYQTPRRSRRWGASPRSRRQSTGPRRHARRCAADPGGRRTRPRPVAPIASTTRRRTPHPEKPSRGAPFERHGGSVS